MDLYSAAKRLNRPFTIHPETNRPRQEGGTGEDSLGIGAHGLIGDGFSCALVRVDGAISWLCMPRFDSPSVFAAILDEERGGVSAVTPVSRPFESLQQYDPETNVLETLFRVPNQGVVRLTDFMPADADPRAAIHEVHRRVECVQGAVDVEVTFDPRFDYGRAECRLEHNEHGVCAVGPAGERITAALEGGGRWEDRPAGGVRTRLSIRAGERRWFVLSWDAPRPEPIIAYRSFHKLRQTRHYWRNWARGIRYDGPWRHMVIRSALLLKLLNYSPTGAMVAAATASLPEWVGGGRNWDYRYTWTRDTAMAIRAANQIGFGVEAREFFHFVRDTLDGNHILQVMYAIDGTEVPDETTLDLRGFRGSGPVRIGNGARDQTQLDTAGALLDAAYLYEQMDGGVTLRVWRHLDAVIRTVSQRWREPDHGIWEPRGAMRHNVHSKLMSWLALDRGSRMASLFGDRASASAWAEECGQVRHDVLSNGLDASGRHFVAAYGHEVPDAALLLLPIHRFVEPRDPLVTRTIAWLRSELGSGSFLYRYQDDDGVGGPEGAFVLCGFWLAEALAMSGRLDEAQRVFVDHTEASNHVGLLAEEVDPTDGQGLGNFPQAFSHLGLINAAVSIDRGLQGLDDTSDESR